LESGVGYFLEKDPVPSPDVLLDTFRNGSRPVLPMFSPAAMDWGSGTLCLDGGCIRSNHRRILIPTETKMKISVAQFFKSVISAEIYQWKKEKRK
jgi:hypothetical protein